MFVRCGNSRRKLTLRKPADPRKNRSTTMLVLAWLAAAAWWGSGEGSAPVDPSELLMSTEWLWNSWRNVKFHAPRREQHSAKFWAPTEDCESGHCSWSANSSGIYIMWGDAGLHHLTLHGWRARRRLRGEPASCRRKYVREELLEQQFTSMLGRLRFGARTHSPQR